LTKRLADFSKVDMVAAKAEFHETRDRKLGNALKAAFSPNRIELCAYRPFDRRWCYRHPEFIDFIRPKLDEYWTGGQSTLYTMHKKIGAGPAVLVHALKPDYHAFRGSYGGYAFPLYDRRPGGDGFNLDLRLVRTLGDASGREIAAEEIFDAVVSVLSAPSYARRFAADLEDAFPHVPFPADLDVFRQAAEVGERIRRLQTFDMQPEQRFWTARLEGHAKDRILAVPKIGSAFLDQGNDFGTMRLAGTLRLERVPLRVWEFAVSGYRVVYRWLEARNGLSLDQVIDEETGETLQRQVLDLIARVAAYIDACDAAEPILEAALASPVTKSDLKYTQAALV
jgi:predicted helicase